MPGNRTRIGRRVIVAVVQFDVGCQQKAVVDERTVDVFLHLRRVEADLLLHPDGLIGGNHDRADCRAFAATLHWVFIVAILSLKSNL